MNHCDTCKHWCANGAGRRSGMCFHDSLDGNNRELPEDGAWGVGYDEPDSIETGPHFGCVHWTAKETR